MASTPRDASGSECPFSVKDIPATLQKSPDGEAPLTDFERGLVRLLVAALLDEFLDELPREQIALRDVS